MKRPIIVMLFCIITCYLSGQTVVKLLLPNNCNADTTTITQADNLLQNRSSKLELYPNPNSGNFTLIISFNDIISKAVINIYDTNGKSAYSETVFSDSNKLVKQLHIGGLLAGTYVFEVKTVKDISSTKLVINK